MRCHEDDGDFRAHRLQPPPRLDAGYATQMDVEDYTGYLGSAVVIEKRLAAVVHLRSKVRRVQHPLESPQDARVVVDDRNHFWSCRQLTAFYAGAGYAPAESKPEATELFVPQVRSGSILSYGAVAPRSVAIALGNRHHC